MSASEAYVAGAINLLMCVPICVVAGPHDRCQYAWLTDARVGALRVVVTPTAYRIDPRCLGHAGRPSVAISPYNVAAKLTRSRADAA